MTFHTHKTILMEATMELLTPYKIQRLSSSMHPTTFTAEANSKTGRSKVKACRNGFHKGRVTILSNGRSRVVKTRCWRTTWVSRNRAKYLGDRTLPRGQYPQIKMRPPISTSIQVTTKVQSLWTPCTSPKSATAKIPVSSTLRAHLYWEIWTPICLSTMIKKSKPN